MATYAFITEGVCAAQATYSPALDPAPEGAINVEAADGPFVGRTYSRGVWGPALEPASERRRVSVLAFRRRFTPAERAAIEWAAVDRADLSLAQRQQAAALRATLADQAAAKFIDLDDNDTATGVQDLESMGLIEPGRAAQILNNTIQPEELP